MKIRIALGLLPFLIACAGPNTEINSPQGQTLTPEPTSTPQETPAEAPTDSSQSTPEDACAGQVDQPPQELKPSNEEPPSFAIGAPGKGSLCEARVFTVSAPITVYRLFSASYSTSKRAGPVGAYWTLQKPSGSADAYRTANVICAEWNDLDMLNQCQIDVGSKVVIGPGQSASCENGVEFKQSATNQVLIVRTADGKTPVSNCAQTRMNWSAR